MPAWGKPWKQGKTWYIYYYSGNYNQWKWKYSLGTPKYGTMSKDLKLKSVSRAFDGR